MRSRRWRRTRRNATLPTRVANDALFRTIAECPHPVIVACQRPCNRGGCSAGRVRRHRGLLGRRQVRVRRGTGRDRSGRHLHVRRAQDRVFRSTSADADRSAVRRRSAPCRSVSSTTVVDRRDLDAAVEEVDRPRCSRRGPEPSARSSDCSHVAVEAHRRLPGRCNRDGGAGCGSPTRAAQVGPPSSTRHESVPRHGTHRRTVRGAPWLSDDEACIVGIGETDYCRAPGSGVSELELVVLAARRALPTTPVSPRRPRRRDDAVPERQRRGAGRQPRHARPALRGPGAHGRRQPGGVAAAARRWRSRRASPRPC